MKPSNDLNFPERLAHDDCLRGTSDRAFGLTFALFWTIVALAPFTRGGSIRVWAAILATVFLVCALARPALLGSLNLQWQRFGRFSQKFTNPIVMALLFFSSVVPLGLIMRLLKRDALRLRRDPELTTYWIPRNPSGPPPESMKDQF
jgi:formate-dependent nitrite reductase membrane component NrfD